MNEIQHKCINEDRIRSLETGQAETKIYVKQILDGLQEVKADLKKQQTEKADTSKSWQPVVIELIKLAGLCITILGAVAGVAKIIGK